LLTYISITIVVTRRGSSLDHYYYTEARASSLDLDHYYYTEARA